MIVIFTEQSEHDKFNDLLICGKRIDCFEPFRSALYVNSYRIGIEIVCDYVRNYINSENERGVSYVRKS